MGQQLGSFTPDVDPGLGVRSVAWHPTSSFVAIGGWDDKVCFNFRWESHIPFDIIVDIGPYHYQPWMGTSGYVRAVR